MWRTTVMKMRFAGLTLLLVVLSLAMGCASKGKTTAAGPKVDPSQITVYESTDLLHSQYTLVQHVWVDSWRSNISIPSFGTEAEGVNAMKRVASDAGANALLHVLCVDGRTRPGAHASLYCYGDAIRVN